MKTRVILTFQERRNSTFQWPVEDKRDGQAEFLEFVYFVVFLALKVKPMILLSSPPKLVSCKRIWGGGEENIYILEEWHNFLFKTSSNAESPGKTFQFDFPSCESNQKLLSRFNLLMRSSDWKLVIALSAWLIISILVSNSFSVWKYLCMVMN